MHILIIIKWIKIVYTIRSLVSLIKKIHWIGSKRTNLNCWNWFALWMMCLWVIILNAKFYSVQSQATKMIKNKLIKVTYKNSIFLIGLLSTKWICNVNVTLII